MYYPLTLPIGVFMPLRSDGVGDVRRSTSLGDGVRSCVGDLRGDNMGNRPLAVRRLGERVASLCLDRPLSLSLSLDRRRWSSLLSRRVSMLADGANHELTDVRSD